MEKLECLPHNDANSCSILRGADVANNSLGQGCHSETVGFEKGGDCIQINAGDFRGWSVYPAVNRLLLHSVTMTGFTYWWHPEQFYFIFALRDSRNPQNYLYVTKRTDGSGRLRLRAGQAPELGVDLSQDLRVFEQTIENGQFFLRLLATGEYTDLEGAYVVVHSELPNHPHRSLVPCNS
ncbi:unnamed protein product [Clavelina lepadiformis]|uniref:Uncharacterized protein n=1 Tax=Clavelina lepadiformis TaxID=159417 RepID=A0ABP0FEX6_CLALP